VNPCNIIIKNLKILRNLSAVLKLFPCWFCRFAPSIFFDGAIDRTRPTIDRRTLLLASFGTNAATDVVNEPVIVRRTLLFSPFSIDAATDVVIEPPIEPAIDCTEVALDRMEA
jgi:hypothetical protein